MYDFDDDEPTFSERLRAVFHPGSFFAGAAVTLAIVLAIWMA